MKTTLHLAFWRRNRDKFAAFAVAVLAMIPEGMPKDMTVWLADQFPWIPIQVCWGASVGIAVWRIWAGVRLLSKVETDVERRRRG